MYIYGKIGSSSPIISQRPLNDPDLILMQTERPTPDHIAQADGTWGEKPYTVEDLYADTRAFLYADRGGQTNELNIIQFEKLAEDGNVKAQENMEWFRGVWTSYFQKKALLPAKYEIDYPPMPHSYMEVVSQ